MAKLDAEDIEKLVVNFVMEKSSGITNILFEKEKSKDSFYEYRISSHARSATGITFCIFCKVEAMTRRIVNFTHNYT